MVRPKIELSTMREVLSVQIQRPQGSNTHTYTHKQTENITSERTNEKDLLPRRSFASYWVQTEPLRAEHVYIYMYTHTHTNTSI